MKLKLSILVVSIITACGNKSTNQTIDLIPVKSGQEYQYIDAKGSIVINPQFSEASIFYDNLALVKSSGNDPMWGYINKKGKYDISANYVHATTFNDGLAWVVSENAAPTAIDQSGEIKITLQDAEEVFNFSEGLAVFSVESEEGVKWGFVDKTGAIKINPQFSKAGRFSDGLCAVRNNDGKWGYIDKTGTITINYQFEMAEEFKNKQAVVKSGGKAGLIEKTGKYIINPQYSSISNDGKLFMITQNGKYGWCDKDGKLIINPQFNSALPFNGQKLAPVSSGNTWGYINQEGKIIITPQFDKALPFNGKLAMVLSSNKIGFIDADGKYVINPQFDNTSPDLLYYITTGQSKYNSVTTEYFNVNAISSVVDFNNPFNLGYSTSFKDALTALNVDTASLNEYTTNHRVKSNEQINKDAKYDMYIIGEAFKTMYSHAYGQMYTNKEFDGELLVGGYGLVFKLANKGSGKAEALFNDLTNKLSGFDKQEKESKEKELVFVRDNIKVNLNQIGESSVELAIYIDHEKAKKETKKEVEKVASETPTKQETKVTVKYRIEDPDGYSNLRDAPNGSILKKVLENERFEVIDEQSNHKKVKLSDGTVGFIHKSRVVEAN